MPEVYCENGTTYTGVVSMHLTICNECGVPFGVPDKLDDSLRNTHKTFYCPLGHSLHYPGLSKSERLQRDLAAQMEQTRIAKREATLESQRRQSVEASLRTTKGHVTRIKKRIGRGVCPCCNRHFANVENHMRTQHPEYAKEDRDVKE